MMDLESSELLTQPMSKTYSQDTSAMSKSENKQSNVWGYLAWHSYKLPSIYHLTKDCHVFGRKLKHDFIFSETLHNIPEDVIINISRTHFTIENRNNRVILEDLSMNGTYINGKRVGGESEANDGLRVRKVVLQDHDKITICDAKGPSCLFTLARKVNEYEKDMPPELLEKYRISQILGTGGSATVYLAYENSSCTRFAVKRMDKDFKAAGMNSVAYIQAEIQILKSLSHPNIVMVKDVIDVERQTFIVMEYMEGGSLANVFSKNRNKPFDERLCKVWFYQLLLSLDYLNSKSIIHRDIKMENILVTNLSRNSPIKLADFGLSKIVSQSKKAVTCCGSYEYVAPEVITSEGKAGQAYSSKVDIWSLGVTLFVCLSGKMPFSSEEPAGLKREILSGALKMDGPEWDQISSAAKETVVWMLKLDPDKRMSAKELLESPWFAEKKFEIVKELCRKKKLPPPRFNNQNERPLPAKVAKVEDPPQGRISPRPSTSKCYPF